MTLTCKQNWDNTCTGSSDCCSGNCDNHGGEWLQGVCKPGSVNSGPVQSNSGGGLISKLKPSGSGNCKPNWDNTCTGSSDCCSGNCDNHDGQWLQGVCKP